jgi:K+ transporter
MVGAGTAGAIPIMEQLASSLGGTTRTIIFPGIIGISVLIGDSVITPLVTNGGRTIIIEVLATSTGCTVSSVVTASVIITVINSAPVIVRTVTGTGTSIAASICTVYLEYIIIAAI